MPDRDIHNYAFIDAQNLYMGVRKLGWKLDYLKFRRYLSEKYHVTCAYMFLGFLVNNQDLYQFLQKVGYILIFRQTVLGEDQKVKGNIDVDLTMRAMIDLPHFTRAVIITSDGDFYPLVEYLYEKDKLEKVISPYRYYCSRLLQKSAKERIIFLDRAKSKLEYIKTKREVSD